MLANDHLGSLLYEAVLFDFNFKKLRFFSSAWNPFSAEIKCLCSAPQLRKEVPHLTNPRLPLKVYYNFKPWRLASEALKPLFMYNLDGVILSNTSNVIPQDISPAGIQWVKGSLEHISICSALLLHQAASAIVPLPLHQSLLWPGEESLCYCKRCRLDSLQSHSGNKT